MTTLSCFSLVSGTITSVRHSQIHYDSRTQYGSKVPLFLDIDTLFEKPQCKRDSRYTLMNSQKYVK
ncbi:hypothetical protein BDZ94DRAFT_1247809 [Collybia nuda]|uniref:Uncharacterized protein n=1 Tax=Collybia nuda TaxID=64659 RepID=A0A9P5YFV1_9AGAR|nr:hypothetical protein BDZ94DRAFT_1247809 [Collybia nuda]